MFGSMQMAVSRVIKLQHHRIAQVLAMALQAGWRSLGGSLAHRLGGAEPGPELQSLINVTLVQSRPGVTFQDGPWRLLLLQSPFSPAAFDS